MPGKLKQYYKGSASMVIIKNTYQNKKITVRAYGKVKVKKVKLAANEYRKPRNKTISKKLATS